MAVVSDVSGQIMIDLPSMLSLIKQLKALAESFDTTLNELHDDVDKLDEKWVGVNHDRFRAFFDERYQPVLTRSEALTRMSETMHSAMSSYSSLSDNLTHLAKASKVSSTGGAYNFKESDGVHIGMGY